MATAQEAKPDLAEPSTEDLRVQLEETTTQLARTTVELDRTTEELRALGEDLERVLADVEPLASAVADREDRLRRTQQTLEAFQMATAAGIVIVDAELTVTQWSDAMPGLWKVSAAKAVDQALDSLPVDGIAEVAEATGECLRTRSRRAVTRGEVVVEAAPMLQGDNTPVGAVLLVRRVESE